jgi:hypothetical protein
MRLVALTLLLPLVACREPLSGPQAKRIADALTDPWADTSRVHLERLWQRLGARHFQPDSSSPGGSFDLEVDGALHPTRGFVLQVTADHAGPLPESCRGDRYTLIAWTLSRPSRGLTLSGVDFAQAIVPPGPCAGGPLGSPRPGVTLRALSGPDGTVWVGTSGRASIRLVDLSEGCPFVTRDGMKWLEAQGIACQAAAFAVEASAALDEGPSGGPAGVSHRVMLPATTVPGVRWTLDCGRQPDYVAICGRRDSARAGA